MLSPKVRQVLELVDDRYRQQGMSDYKALEAAFDEARQSGNKLVETETSWEMGARLLSIASLAGAFGQQGQLAGLMPNLSELLEPAIQLFDHSLETALSINHKKYEKLARDMLAACYIEGGQFEQALEYLIPLSEICSMPEDALLCYSVTQKIGDCYFHLENDIAARNWYQQGLSIAQEIDDPFEISVQLGKIASALSNLKVFDEAIEYYTQSRDLLARIGADEELLRKITVHKNTFNVAAIPNVVAYTDERIALCREGLGRELIRELPQQIAAATVASIMNRGVPKATDWAVFRALDTAVRSATEILSELLEANQPSADTLNQESTLRMVGDFARRHFGETIQDPDDLAQAARYLMQIDRTRRASSHVQRWGNTTAGPGPFGGGGSGHIVYLRSFVASPRLPVFEVDTWGRVDLEELLACKLDTAPLVELGNIEIERFGPGVARTSDENWREVLRALAMEAQMLLVIPAPTQGTSWEIEWVVINKFLHKTCFVMPPPRDGEEDWWIENWRILKDWTVRLGINFPEYTPEGCIFRLTSEGLVDQLDFSVVYKYPDLRTMLLFGLLGRPNISYDFLYAAQQQFEQEKISKNDNAAVAGDVPEEFRAIVSKLETATRLELSNWHYDEPQTPKESGIILYFETPFRMLWAEEVNVLQDALSRHVQGEASDFTRALFHLRIIPLLNAAEVSQLLDSSLDIETIMSFRVKQMISYRFCPLHDPEERAQVLDLIWGGKSKFGTPELPRPE